MAPPRLRTGARAVLFDPNDRVLLVHFRMPHIELWAPPGGGVEEGESLVDAVRRELHEEVGHHDADIGPAIWTRRHLFTLSGYDGQHDTFFLARVTSEEPRAALLSPERLLEENVTTSAWWSLDDLLRSDEVFAPRRLPHLVADLIENGPPESPIDVGV